MMIPRPVVEWPARAASATFYRPKRFIGSALTLSMWAAGRSCGDRSGLRQWSAYFALR
jgi:hypothetical protein